MKIFLASLITIFSFQAASASIFDFNLWGADSKLKKENYEAAVKDYLKIQAKDPSNNRLNYNLGIGLYRLGAFDNAAFNFQQTAQKTQSPVLKERALYNLGNSLFKKEDYENAIKAYEAALKIDPDDEDTKYNLELAKKKLEQKKNQDQNKDDQKKDQDQNKDQQNKDQQDQNKDDQNKDQDKKDQDQNQDQEDKDQQEQNKDDQKKNQDQQKQKSKPKEQKGDLDEQELKMLLMQVKEGQPKGNALGVKRKKNQDTQAKLKPW